MCSRGAAQKAIAKGRLKFLYVSTQANVGWKSKEAPSQHATGCSISKSLPLEAFDELGYPPPLNSMECGFQMVGMSRRLEVHDPAGAPYRSRAL